MKCHCVIVPKEKAEEVRRKLVDGDLLVTGLRIKRDEKNVYFPVKKKVDMDGCFSSMEDFEEIGKKSYLDILKAAGIRPESISIDFIGSIALLRMKDESVAIKVAEALLETNRNVRTVCLDRGVEGDYRVRNVEVIAGEKKTEAIHREYGLRIKLDVAKTYFSPRLATERIRVAKQVAEGSVVVDMFAGVAPFSLVIAKYARPSKIYAIDVNPYAVRYARENVMLNGMAGIIEVIEGDAKGVIKKLPHANHIIMNLPHSSFHFLPDAIGKGDIIHYYEIMDRGREKERIDEICGVAREHGFEIEVKNLRVVGSYSPSKQKMGMELYVKPI